MYKCVCVCVCVLKSRAWNEINNASIDLSKSTELFCRPFFLIHLQIHSSSLNLILCVWTVSSICRSDFTTICPCQIILFKHCHEYLHSQATTGKTYNIMAKREIISKSAMCDGLSATTTLWQLSIRTLVIKRITKIFLFG